MTTQIQSLIKIFSKFKKKVTVSRPSRIIDGDQSARVQNSIIFFHISHISLKYNVIDADQSARVQH